MKRNTIECAEALAYAKTLPDASVHCIVTSPPYFGLRDYSTGTWEGGDGKCDHKVRKDAHAESSTLDGGKGTVGHSKEGFKHVCPRCGAVRKDEQLGLEQTPEAYVDRLVAIFREYRRVLRDDGTLWIVIGDSYNANGRQGHGTRQGYKQQTNRASAAGVDKCRSSDATLKEKDLLMIPARLAIALCNDGWTLRQEIVWAKKNGMPESVQDRCTRSHEMIYMFAKQSRYWSDMEAIKRPAQSDSNARLLRAFGNSTKYVDGAPGQPPHGILKPRPNGNKQDGVGKRQYDGFNGRYYDNPAPMANARSVWKFDEETDAFLQFLVAQLGEERYFELAEEFAESQGYELDVWEIATVSGMEGHYATFPPKLAERMILAGCPHKTCAKCGAPWTREYEKTGYVNSREPAHAANNTPTKVDSTGWKPIWRLTGNWIPTCKCETTETVPGIVLDPFMGSGTTARVAVNLGRDFLGCDLNPEYVQKALSSLERGIQMPLLEVIQA